MADLVLEAASATELALMRPDRFGLVRLKKHYTSREVAGLTGLTARQLQWWDARRLFKPAVAPHRTEAGGFTERRYTPLDVLELQVLADLRRRGFSIPRLRRLLVDAARRLWRAALRGDWRRRADDAVHRRRPAVRADARTAGCSISSSRRSRC